MRILVTKQGTYIIQELEDPTGNDIRTQNNRCYSQPKKTSNMANPNLITKPRSLISTLPKVHPRMKSTNSFLKMQTSNINNKSKFFQTSGFTIETDDNFNNSPKLKNAKTVNIKSKIPFPKKFKYLYENDQSSTKNIISSDNFLNTITNQDTNENEEELPNPFRLFAFNEVIPNQTVNQLRTKFVREQRERDKHTRITEQDFRSTYQNKTKLEQLDDMMSVPFVQSNKHSLLKYLNVNKKIGPLTLRKLYDSDNQKLNRLNKLCQIAFYEEERQNLRNEIIQKKVWEKSNSKRVEFQKSINKMESEVGEIKEKLDKYKKKYNEKDKYLFLHREFKKYWKLHGNFERFNKKKSEFKEDEKVTKVNTLYPTYHEDDSF